MTFYEIKQILKRLAAKKKFSLVYGIFSLIKPKI